MSVIIDVDVLENILKFNHRRKKDQDRVYALIFGSVSGNTYHIKHCLYGILYPDENQLNVSIYLYYNILIHI